MKKSVNHILSSSLFGAALLMASSMASAASLSLQPAGLTVTPGMAFSVDLQVSGVGSPAPGSIGGFDLEISFDPAVLSLQSYSLGGFLGDVGQFEAADFSLLQSGKIQLTEVSFLATAALDALQPGSFKLATINFMAATATPPGGSPVSITRLWSLGLATGLPLDDVTLSDVTVTAVPEASTCALMLAGLALLAATARRRRGGPATGRPAR